MTTLANGFLAHGHAVMRGTREPAKLEAWKQGAKGDASTGTFAEAAAWGEVIVLAVKGTAAEAVVKACVAERSRARRDRHDEPDRRARRRKTACCATSRSKTNR